MLKGDVLVGLSVYESSGDKIGPGGLFCLADTLVPGSLRQGAVYGKRDVEKTTEAGSLLG